MKNQKGFGAVETILVLVIVGLIGGVGWYVWDAKKESDKSLNQASQTEIVAANKSKLSEYKNEELGLSLKYPKEWGDASAKEGTFLKFQGGSYKQLTFSKNTLVDINFVAGPYSTPLDACGYGDVVMNAQHYLNGKRASVIGWEGENIKEYWEGQGFDKPTVRLINTGWQKVETVDKVIVYKDIDQNPIKEETDCGPASKAQLEEANGYYKFTHFAANFSNPKVFGVNAQYDTRKSEDANMRSQIEDLLNSLK